MCMEKIEIHFPDMCTHTFAIIWCRVFRHAVEDSIMEHEAMPSLEAEQQLAHRPPSPKELVSFGTRWSSRQKRSCARCGTVNTTLWRDELCDRCYTPPPRSQRGGICNRCGIGVVNTTLWKEGRCGRCDSSSLKRKQLVQKTVI